jgi:FkbM family methyltransferase
MKNILKKIFWYLGIEINKRKKEPSYGYFRNKHMIDGMQRAFFRGLHAVETIVDIGAAEGAWSLSAKEIWPNAKYVLFEPLYERNTVLENLSKKNPEFYFVPKAAGSEKSEISFYVSNDLDGSGVTQDANLSDNVRTVEVTSVDIEVNTLKLNGPYIVKLDTHGFEVPIIEGCSQILDQVAMFIIECYGFQIAKNSLLFWQMCQYMEDKGFRLVDIVDICHRPSDQTFWQCDAFFIPKTSPGLDINTFSI